MIHHTTRITGTILLAIALCTACGSKIQVTQAGSDYPVVLVKGKNVKQITTIRLPIVLHISKRSSDDISLGSVSYWHGSQSENKSTWQPGATLYKTDNDTLTYCNQLQEIGFGESEFVIYTRHHVLSGTKDEIEYLFQPYYDYMEKNGKDTMHIASLNDWEKSNPGIVRNLLEGDSILLRMYKNGKMQPQTYPVQITK